MATLLLFLLMHLATLESGRCQNGEGGGYWSIQLSPDSISSVPFRGRRISIWEHAAVPGRYYAMPLVDLLPVTARSFYNVLLGKHEMTFDVLMWSEDAGDAVFQHLQAEGRTGVGGAELTVEDIELLPMEKVRLTWHGTDSLQLSEFSLQDKWMWNTHLPNVRSFYFTCKNEGICDGLAKIMLEHPGSFHGLTMEYIINGQRSARRQVQITGQNVMSGKLYASLANMPGAARSTDVRHLSSEDLKKLVYESTQSVVALVVSDSDYVDTGDEVSVSNLLERELARQEVSSRQLRPRMWESVYWDPSWARPDKLTSYMNRALTKDATDNSSFVLSESARAQETSSGDHDERGGDDDRFGFVKSFVTEQESGSENQKVDKEQLLRALSEHHQDVEWTGEKFRIKPMKLYRLNLSSFKSGSNIAVANLQVHRYETVHAIKVSVSGNNRAPGQQFSLWEKLDDLEVRVAESVGAGLQRTRATLDEHGEVIAAMQGKLKVELERHRDDMAAVETRLREDVAAAISETEAAVQERIDALEAKVAEASEALGDDLDRDVRAELEFQQAELAAARSDIAASRAEVEASISKLQQGLEKSLDARVRRVEEGQRSAQAQAAQALSNLEKALRGQDGAVAKTAKADVERAGSALRSHLTALFTGKLGELRQQFSSDLSRQVSAAATRSAVQCEWEWIYLSCPAGTRISVVSSNYGRRDSTVCRIRHGHSQWANTNCIGGNIAPFRSSCDRRQSCSFKVDNGWYGSDPCSNTYKYLEVAYKCA